MKFASALAFAGLASAQVATLIATVNGVNQATADLNTAVKSFSGASDVKALQAASDKLGSAVTAGVSTVNGASTITLTDAVQIQGQVQNLQTAVESVVNDLISKKQSLYSAGAGAQVESNLQDQLKGAQALSSAISSKVPPEVAGLAQTLSAGIATALQKGVDAFKDAPAGGASAGGSSAPAADKASGSSSHAVSSPVAASSAAVSSAAAPKPAKTGASYHASTSSGPKPALYTGAASARNVAGGFAAVAAAVAVAL